MILNKNTQLKHGEYVIIDSLGQGGFGITYLAEQVSLKRKVAIKEFFLRDFCNRDSYTLRVSSTGSTDVVGRFRDKFLKEAYTIAGLDHPNIVRIIDVFEENDTAYYVMEYHSGCSLGSVVDKQGAMSEEQALRYIRQVASALKYIHSRRMMHLDIKPDNILLNSRGEAVLIDFGISKVFEDEIDNVKRPRTSTIAAYSPGFAPKEQYNPKGVTEFSPATDIYSLGATLFTLLIGECPPPAIELDESDYIITTLKRSNISKRLSAAVIKAMAYTKKDRPQSVDEFLALLNGDFGGGSKEPKKPFNWKPLVGIIAAILCIVFAGVGINECNDYHNKQIRLDSIAKEKARQDSIAAADKKRNAFETKIFNVKGIEFKMVAVEGGTFNMGSNDSEALDVEKPIHSVTLSDYYIGETEVTQELWEAVMGSNPSYFKGDKNPVEQVSYNDCVGFINKLNILLAGQLPDGRKFRLPTEAQWEFAARGGNKGKNNNNKYSGSNSIDDVAWYDDNSLGITHPVKQKQVNELGLYDMSGNVWEWCSDLKDSYSSSPQTNPEGPSSGEYRVLRGGSWDYNAQYCRVARRSSITPVLRSSYCGLRLAF